MSEMKDLESGAAGAGGPGRHILILNRFDRETDCRYPRYVDHAVDRVAYIASTAGHSGVDTALAEAVGVVDDLADWQAVSKLALGIVREFGPLDHVVALFERDLEVAARLRELLDVPGPRPAEIERVRDKVTMKELVVAAGLRVPRFTDVGSPEQVARFAEETGFPVVLKPRDGSGSQGIYLINSAASLAETLASPLENYSCEEFIDATMYQVDGVVQDGAVRVLRAFRLLNTCLDYTLGQPFGSVASDDPVLEKRLAGYSEVVMAALGVRDSVFHLEVFVVDRPADPTAVPAAYDDLVFLEVAARPGGAELPHLWREVYGLDLLEVATRLTLGESPRLAPSAAGGEAGGYLLMPEPPVRPCRVVSTTSLLDRVPEMYAEVLPAPGAVLDGTGGAKETGGRYRFRAATGRDVERAVRQVIDAYELAWEPVDEGERVVRRTAGRAQSVARP
ncbi:ATP-grasp domain-containing protein [Actinokineospora alba]|uniref:ATP-grasp domain-containing protein n=1 Tax=Actinokineospora alba TaxID=504798 RepID=A0A1H0W255_9PSEU|nr:ATP-grasp domain-containing protein [Actinokineospora alba]TDP67790.1 ATP-grasp domain-containing protein [Actinokineospora alba]SDI71915.1 ATP-grasp domain-containing protein [Actinokineospora alba]SDP84797.1 ATP-grasp domain-containing protein [Actinokineospora alba]